MAELAIEAEGISKRFGSRWALAQVSLKVPAGTVLMIAGRNGSGKSTLLRVLATAIRPDLGRVNVLGFDVVTQKFDVRNAVALLSHYSYLYETLTARENLEVAADHMRRRRAGIVAALDRVGLSARADDAVSTFSAGMRKRLSFARVLLQKPEVALLDEPYAALDPEGFDLVDDVVRELRSHGTTVLIASHQLERTTAVADEAITLEDGRIQ
jgi:heme exporter protein A